MAKPVKIRDGREYVEADREDIETARKLSNEILGRSLDDLNSVSRDLLQQIARMVGERTTAQKASEHRRNLRPAGLTFTRRDIREYTGWPHTRVARYLKQLLDM